MAPMPRFSISRSMSFTRPAWRQLSAACVAVLAGGFGTVAHADPLAHCGNEPDAPALPVGDAEHYNASVDRFKAYEAAARVYNKCVSAAASKEEAAISDEARDRIAKIHAQSVAVQKRIAANFTKGTATLKAGAQKLSPK